MSWRNTIIFRQLWITKIGTFFKHVVAELLVLALLILTINNFIGNSNITIHADGEGYYDHLPSLFIHGDLNRHGHSQEDRPELYTRINEINGYVTFEKYWVNKYACGTALLQLPFFLFTYAINGDTQNLLGGYGTPFHRTVYHAALFFFFLSLYYFRCLLQLYDIDRGVIIICQLLLTLATTVTHYVSFSASYSHIYSLFAITAFLYHAKRYFIRPSYNDLLFTCALLGLVVIVRQVNILILLLVPFLAGNASKLRTGIRYAFSDFIMMFKGLICFLIVFSIQSIVWYLQTGQLLIYSYQGEYFDLLHPRIMDVLFSFRKGLFVYTPALLISLVSIAWMAVSKRSYLAATWLFYFAALTYILSSWWSWSYGASYGLRPYVDHYTVFFIPISIFLNALPSIGRILLVIVALPAIPLNVVQSYQYKEFILDWEDMDREKYFTVFLKTADKYRGALWYDPIDISKNDSLFEHSCGDIILRTNKASAVCATSTLDLSSQSVIQVSMQPITPAMEDVVLIISIDEPLTETNHFRHGLHVYHFQMNKKGDRSTYEIKIPPIQNTTDVTLSLEFISRSQNVDLKDVQLIGFAEEAL